MALVGNCSNITYTNHKTKTKTETITNSDGTIETYKTPVQIPKVTNYTDVYLCIKQVEFFNSFNGIEKILNVVFQYAAYADVKTRNTDQENYLFWNNSQLQNHDHKENLYSSIYNQIKLIEGLTNLTDI